MLDIKRSVLLVVLLEAFVEHILVTGEIKRLMVNEKEQIFMVLSLFPYYSCLLNKLYSFESMSACLSIFGLCSYRTVKLSDICVHYA